MKIDRQKVYEKYDKRCGYCGDPIDIKAMQVDHVIPKRNYFFHLQNKFKIPAFLSHLKLNDLNHFDNLMPACRVCNKWKDAHDLEGFRKELQEQIKRLNDYSSNFRVAKKYGLVIESNLPIQFHFEIPDATSEGKTNKINNDEKQQQK